jgi:hypothetical protein
VPGDQVHEQVVGILDVLDADEGHALILQRGLEFGHPVTVHQQLQTVVPHAHPPRRGLDAFDPVGRDCRRRGTRKPEQCQPFPDHRDTPAPDAQ